MSPVKKKDAYRIGTKIGAWLCTNRVKEILVRHGAMYVPTD